MQGIENAGIREAALKTLVWGADYLLKTYREELAGTPGGLPEYNIVYQVCGSKNDA